MYLAFVCKSALSNFFNSFSVKKPAVSFFKTEFIVIISQQSSLNLVSKFSLKFFLRLILLS
jgi:hypothetical protein